jgi:hypothetical protein
MVRITAPSPIGGLVLHFVNGVPRKSVDSEGPGFMSSRPIPDIETDIVAVMALLLDEGQLLPMPFWRR